MKLQFNRLHSLTWILSIKLRTFGACGEGANAPRASPLVTCLWTMAEITRARQVAKAMKEYGIEVLGISETRWKGTAQVILQSGDKVVYVGNDEVQQGGVAMMMSAGQKEPRWNGHQLAKGSLQHNSTQSTKKCWWYKHMHQQMRRWMRKRMNSTTSCRTLFQAATEKIYDCGDGRFEC